MSDIRLAVFDLDGTAANTLENLAFCANSVIAGYGMSPIEAWRFKYFVGDGSYVQMRRLLEYKDLYHGEEDKPLLDELFGKYIDFLAVHCADNVVPYDGIIETVGELKKRGIQSVVFSNKPHRQAVKVIETVFPEDCFSAVRGQVEGFPRKPDPEGALILAEQAKVKPEECIYLGDTNTDMQTGKAAGMLTLGVLWGFRERDELEKAGADHIISAPAEILNYI